MRAERRPVLGSTVVVLRVDLAGRTLWRAETGIDRFTLSQVLPGATSTVFVGTRPRVPDRVPELPLAIVDHGSGEGVTHSLARRGRP